MVGLSVRVGWRMIQLERAISFLASLRVVFNVLSEVVTVIEGALKTISD